MYRAVHAVRIMYMYVLNTGITPYLSNSSFFCQAAWQGPGPKNRRLTFVRKQLTHKRKPAVF